jgi:hypothetical protein
MYSTQAQCHVAATGGWTDDREPASSQMDGQAEACLSSCTDQTPPRSLWRRTIRLGEGWAAVIGGVAVEAGHARDRPCVAEPGSGRSTAGDGVTATLLLLLPGDVGGVCAVGDSLLRQRFREVVAREVRARVAASQRTQQTWQPEEGGGGSGHDAS